MTQTIESEMLRLFSVVARGWLVGAVLSTALVMTIYFGDRDTPFVATVVAILGSCGAVVAYAAAIIVRLVTGRPPRRKWWLFWFLFAAAGPFGLIVWFEAVDSYFTGPGFRLSAFIPAGILGAIYGVSVAGLMYWSGRSAPRAK